MNSFDELILDLSKLLLHLQDNANVAQIVAGKIRLLLYVSNIYWHMTNAYVIVLEIKNIEIGRNIIELAWEKWMCSTVIQ